MQSFLSKLLAVACLIPAVIVGAQDGLDEQYYSQDRSRPRKQDVGALLRDLRADDWQIQLRAARAIPFRPGAEFASGIPALVAALQSEHDELKLVSVEGLSRIATGATAANQRQPELSRAIQPLRAILNSAGAEEMRSTAVEALSRIGVHLGADGMRQVIPTLIDAVNDPRPEISQRAMEGLAEFGAAAQVAIPSIIKQLEADDQRVWVAVDTVGNLRSETATCVPALMRLLIATDDPRRVTSVIDALSSFGADAAPATELLASRLDSEHSHVAIAATFAIAEIGPRAATAAQSLEQAYRSVPNEETDLNRVLKVSALSALCAIGPEGEKRAITATQEVTQFPFSGIAWYMNNPAQVMKVLAKAPKLTSLDLRDSRLTVDQLSLIAPMKQLEHLVLAGQDSDAGLKHVAGLTNLQSLANASEVTDAGLAHISALKNLRSLSLSGPITDAGMKSLTELRQLRVLSVYDAKLTNEGLRHLSKLAALQELSLDGEGIDDEGLQHIGTLSKLRSLHLLCRNISGVGMKHLKQLTQLRELNLRGTGIGDDGVKQVAADHPQLKILGLSGCRVTAASADALSKLKRLEYLGLYQTPLAESAQVSVVMDALPQCEVKTLD